MPKNDDDHTQEELLEGSRWNAHKSENVEDHSDKKCTDRNTDGNVDMLLKRLGQQDGGQRLKYGAQAAQPV